MRRRTTRSSSFTPVERRVEPPRARRPGALGALRRKHCGVRLRVEQRRRARAPGEAKKRCVLKGDNRLVEVALERQILGSPRGSGSSFARRVMKNGPGARDGARQGTERTEVRGRAAQWSRSSMRATGVLHQRQLLLLCVVALRSELVIRFLPLFILAGCASPTSATDAGPTREWTSPREALRSPRRGRGRGSSPARCPRAAVETSTA